MSKSLNICLHETVFNDCLCGEVWFRASSLWLWKPVWEHLCSCHHSALFILSPAWLDSNVTPPAPPCTAGPPSVDLSLFSFPCCRECGKQVHSDIWILLFAACTHPQHPRIMPPHRPVLPSERCRAARWDTVLWITEALRSVTLLETICLLLKYRGADVEF